MSVKNLTKEQLLELAKKPLKKAKDMLGNHYNDVQKFAMMNKIQSDAKNAVPTYIIYELYIHWCSVNDMVIIPRQEFFKKFSEMFERIKKSGDTHYLINGQGMDVKEYSSSQKEIMKSAYSKRISANAQKTENRKRTKTKL
jgi:hypothetical protein